MKLLPISQEQFTQVDDEDFEWLSKYKWYYSGGYPKRYNKRNEPLIRMNREVLERNGYDITNKKVDHKNGDTLNNTKDNLRIATHSQNLFNRGKPSSNTSGFKGVSWRKKDKFYEAYITANKKRIRLGCFDNLIAAARAYDKAAIELHGEFAVLNFPDEVHDIITPRKVIIHNNNSTGYRGVSYRKDNKKFRAEFQHNGIKIKESFDTAIEAAQFYNKIATEYLGEKAKLNDI